MVQDLVLLASETVIAKKEISIDSTTGLDMLAILSLQDGLSTARNNNGADFATTLKGAQDERSCLVQMPVPVLLR